MVKHDHSSKATIAGILMGIGMGGIVDGMDVFQNLI